MQWKDVPQNNDKKYSLIATTLKDSAAKRKAMSPIKYDALAVDVRLLYSQDKIPGSLAWIEELSYIDYTML